MLGSTSKFIVKHRADACKCQRERNKRKRMIGASSSSRLYIFDSGKAHCIYIYTSNNIHTIWSESCRVQQILISSHDLHLYEPAKHTTTPVLKLLRPEPTSKNIHTIWSESCCVQQILVSSHDLHLYERAKHTTTQQLLRPEPTESHAVRWQNCWDPTKS